jgi:hypothetical protein
VSCNGNASKSELYSMTQLLFLIPCNIGMNNYKLLASQAQLVNRHKNTRSKLQKCCANIYFNKLCLAKQITPNYINIRIANTSPAAIVTTKKAQKIRIKEEIKFLYRKKET